MSSDLSIEHDAILDVVSDPLELGKALRLARKRADLTQEEVAQKLGHVRTTIVAIEQGYRHVRASELQELATLYHCDLSQFFTQEVQELPAKPILSARKRVLKRVLLREIDPTMYATLQALATSQREMERMAATLLHMLIEREEETGDE